MKDSNRLLWFVTFAALELIFSLNAKKLQHCLCDINQREKQKKKKKKVAMPTANYSITNTQLDLNVCYPSLCLPPNAISIRFIILSLVMLQKQSPHSVTFIFTLHYTTREAVTSMRWLVCVGSVQFGSVWYVGERYAFLYLKCTHT